MMAWLPIKRGIALGLSILLLSSCAAIEHQRIAAEQKRQNEELGIPEHGVNNRNHPLIDAVHGSAWWIGADKAKVVLNEALKK